MGLTKRFFFLMGNFRYVKLLKSTHVCSIGTCWACNYRCSFLAFNDMFGDFRTIEHLEIQVNSRQHSGMGLWDMKQSTWLCWAGMLGHVFGEYATAVIAMPTSWKPFLSISKQ
jgi:hypothetical protein